MCSRLQAWILWLYLWRSFGWTKLQRWSITDLDDADESFKLVVVGGETRPRTFLWFFSHVGCDSPVWVSPPLEFHTNHSVANGHERPWRTAKARVFEMPNLCLQRERQVIPAAALYHSKCWVWRLPAAVHVCLLLEAFTQGGEAQSRVCLNSR